jgi:hypothetical protein
MSGGGGATVEGVTTHAWARRGQRAMDRWSIGCRVRGERQERHGWRLAAATGPIWPRLTEGDKPTPSRAVDAGVRLRSERDNRRNFTPTGVGRYLSFVEVWHFLPAMKK